MIRTVRSFVVATAAVLAVSACAEGGDGGDGGGSDPSGEATGEVDVEAGYAFFAENDIEISLSVDPGGGMDTYARMVAEGLEEQFGNTVTVAHRPGAGGATNGNWLQSQAGDATKIWFNRVSGSVVSQVTEDQRVSYDMAEWNAVGRIVAEPRSISVGAHTGITSLEEFVTTSGLRFGATDIGGGDWTDSTVIVQAFGMDAEVIAGFDGSAAAELAVIRGDVDAQTGSPASRLGAERAGDILQIGAIGAMPLPEEVVDIDRVTLANDLDDLIDGDRGRLLLDAHSAIIELGRGFFAAPDLDQDQLAALRDAFVQMSEDPDFLARMEQADLPVQAMNGEDLDDLVEEIMAGIPDDYLELVSLGGGD